MELKKIIKKVTLTITACAVLVGANYLINKQIENAYREDARYSLNQVSHCITQTLPFYHGSFDDKYAIAFNTCAKFQRVGGPTGDMFAFRINDNKFIADPSMDCHTFDKKADDQAFYNLHNRPDLAKIASDKMREGKSSVAGQNTVWQFDDATEWLEWKIQTSKDVGLPLETNVSIVLAQGVQSDEAADKYKLNYVVFVIGGALLALVAII